MTLIPPDILMVEDDPDQAMLFQLILTKAGYTVAVCPDAESALTRLAESPPTLVLVDLDLPVMKGDTLITIVKAQYPAIKTVIFSNHIHVNQVAAAIGADGWFRKIEDISLLKQLLAKLLGPQAGKG